MIAVAFGWFGEARAKLAPETRRCHSVVTPVQIPGANHPFSDSRSSCAGFSGCFRLAPVRGAETRWNRFALVHCWTRADPPPGTGLVVGAIRIIVAFAILLSAMISLVSPHAGGNVMKVLGITGVVLLVSSTATSAVMHRVEFF